MYAWRWFAELERRLIRALTGVEIQEPYRPEPREAGWSRRIGTRLGDPATWKDLVFLLLQLPLGIALVHHGRRGARAGRLSWIAAPAWYWSMPDGIELGITQVDTLGEALLLVPLGLVVAFVGIPALGLLGRGYGLLARLLLGCNPDPELSAQVTELEGAPLADHRRRRRRAPAHRARPPRRRAAAPRRAVADPADGRDARREGRSRDRGSDPQRGGGGGARAEGATRPGARYPPGDPHEPRPRRRARRSRRARHRPGRGHRRAVGAASRPGRGRRVLRRLGMPRERRQARRGHRRDGLRPDRGRPARRSRCRTTARAAPTARTAPGSRASATAWARSADASRSRARRQEGTRVRATIPLVVSADVDDDVAAARPAVLADDDAATVQAGATGACACMSGSSRASRRRSC